MNIFERREPNVWENAMTFTVGALGGFAAGLLLSGKTRDWDVEEMGEGLRDRARRVATRVRPGRLRRAGHEQDELTGLEDRVLDTFLGDELLGVRGIDVGAISRGIIELSGAVRDRDEVDRAVRLASRVPGVNTVVNRMEIEDELRNLRESRDRFDDEGDTELGWTGRMVGMGRRRQGRDTDPGRPDDSQHQTERALMQADRDQWSEEDISSSRPRMAERPEDVQDRTRFSEDELDHQDPHGKHGTRTLDGQPQELNSAARVGEGLKPGVELALEGTDVPVKPHGRKNSRGNEEGGSAGS